MRIGTWNLDNRWSRAHAALLLAHDCDVWLLTEVRHDVALNGYSRHVSEGAMARGQRWAGVLARMPVTPQHDPHAASASAVVDGVTYCSTILPWRGCGPHPWGDGTTAERTATALTGLLASLPRDGLVWGGDWNHGLVGPERAGSFAGRIHIERALDILGLQIPTRDLPHQRAGLATIDHIAVPKTATIVEAIRVPAQGPRGLLSDHDAYVVEIT